MAGPDVLMAASKKASARSVPESARSTVQVKLRMPRELAAELRALADERNSTLSEVVADAIEVMKSR